MGASGYFGKKLRELRLLSKLTAKQLAAYLNCSPSLIYNIEKGLNRPQPELIVLAAEFFGVTTDFMLREENTGNEEDLLELYRNINPKNKKYLYNLIKLMSS